MPFLVSDVISRSPARATLSDLAEQVKAGAERLDYYHQLEREHIHLRLIDDAGKGLEARRRGCWPGDGCADALAVDQAPSRGVVCRLSGRGRGAGQRQDDRQLRE